MTVEEIVSLFNQNRPACVQTLQGTVLEFLPEQDQLTMRFEPGLHCCHSTDIVQGGYITAMLDAAMAHVTIAKEKFGVNVSSIDINVSFLRPLRAGRARRLVRLSSLAGRLAICAPSCLTPRVNSRQRLLRRLT